MNLDEVSTSTEITDQSTLLYGYSIKAVSDVEVTIRNGDQEAIFILLEEGDTLNEDFRNPLEFSEGIYFNIVSGTLLGTVFYELLLSGSVIYPFRDSTPVRKKDF